MRLLIEPSKIKLVSQQLQKLFDKTDLAEVAQRLGFVQRKRKLGGPDFVHLCIQGVSTDGLLSSLTELCAVAKDVGVELCRQSMNERFNEAGVNLMQSVFDQVLDSSLGQGEKLPRLEQFNGVYVQDATIYQLPEGLKVWFKGSGGGGSEAAIKIDCLTDLQVGKWYLHFKDAVSNDGSARLLSVPSRSLWLRDLGYFKLEDFQTIAEQGAYFVSRLRSDILLEEVQSEGQSIDLLEWAKQMQAGQIKEAKVWAGADRKGPFRLIVQKVPQQVADAKRKKLSTDKQNKRKGLTKRRLALCDVNIFLTNLDTEEWPAMLLIDLYRIRWQIEILFKAWKSILKIGKVHPMKIHRFLCLMYGQMIWAVLNAKIFQYGKIYFWNELALEISELRGFKILRQLKHRLHRAMRECLLELYMEFLELLFLALAKNGVKQPKKSNKNRLLCSC